MRLLATHRRIKILSWDSKLQKVLNSDKEPKEILETKKQLAVLGVEIK